MGSRNRRIVCAGLEQQMSCFGAESVQLIGQHHQTANILEVPFKPFAARYGVCGSGPTDLATLLDS